jgi:hypothetical protein
MGLIRTALIFGAGYAFGRPESRQKVVETAQQLVKRPEVQQLKERGQQTLNSTVKQVKSSTSTNGDGAGTSSGRSFTRAFPRRKPADTVVTSAPVPPPVPPVPPTPATTASVPPVPPDLADPPLTPPIPPADPIVPVDPIGDGPTTGKPSTPPV